MPGLLGYVEVNEPVKAKTLFACWVISLFVAIFLFLAFAETTSVKQHWTDGTAFIVFGGIECFAACVICYYIFGTEKLDAKVKGRVFWLNVGMFAESIESIVYGACFWDAAHAQGAAGFDFFAIVDLVAVGVFMCWRMRDVIKYAFRQAI